MSMHYKKLSIFLLILLMLGFIGCNESSKEQSKTPGPEGPQQQDEQKEPTKQQKEPVHKIKSNEEFKNILENAGTKLLVIDMYADWCRPCRQLAPILAEVAKENPDKADFYKVNTDELRDIAAMFRVKGIPHVVFLKERKVVLALVGLYPKERYIKTINQIWEPQ